MKFKDKVLQEVINLDPSILAGEDVPEEVKSNKKLIE